MTKTAGFPPVSEADQAAEMEAYSLLSKYQALEDSQKRLALYSEKMIETSRLIHEIDAKIIARLQAELALAKDENARWREMGGDLVQGAMLSVLPREKAALEKVMVCAEAIYAIVRDPLRPNDFRSAHDVLLLAATLSEAVEAFYVEFPNKRPEFPSSRTGGHEGA